MRDCFGYQSMSEVLPAPISLVLESHMKERSDSYYVLLLLMQDSGFVHGDLGFLSIFPAAFLIYRVIMIEGDSPPKMCVAG